MTCYTRTISRQKSLSKRRRKIYPTADGYRALLSANVDHLLRFTFTFFLYDSVKNHRKTRSSKPLLKSSVSIITRLYLNRGVQIFCSGHHVQVFVPKPKQRNFSRLTKTRSEGGGDFAMEDR